MLPNQLLLNTYLGRPIREICRNGYANEADNHGAHFVSHAMGYGFGTTCLTLRRGHAFGASIRVHEIFPRCLAVGRWAKRPASMTSCLVFITKASNVDVKNKTMKSALRKHVGIFLSGRIYHYSDIQHRVIQ